MTKRARAVVGANLGDEGKGATVDYLCSKGNAGVVVRFSGGAQAGHTVVTPEGDRHVFRQIGSGSFHGVPTFFSSYVLVNPISILLEIEKLDSLGVQPELYASPECLVTTFADMLINRRLEDARGAGRHGSCGMGIGETVERSTVPNLKITMADLWNGNERSLESRLSEICEKYAQFRTGSAVVEPKMQEAFMRACKVLPEYVSPAGIGQCKDPIFEGTQGLLLSQDNEENFPHVSRAFTGMQNVKALCGSAGIEEIEAYYVTRTYLTRHGAGPLQGEDSELQYFDDTNSENTYQGKLRFAPLDLAGLGRRIRKDFGSSMDARVVVTHRDQLELPELKGSVNFYGPTREDVREG